MGKGKGIPVSGLYARVQHGEMWTAGRRTATCLHLANAGLGDRVLRRQLARGCGQVAAERGQLLMHLANLSNKCHNGSG